MSSLSKAPLSSNCDISTEESGWTMYFEEFFNDHHHNNHNCSISLSVVASSSHIVSDATSLVEKKIPSGEHVEELSSLNENDKRSSFKRRRNIIEALVDEALEDTATSCLNSPKVFFLHYFFFSSYSKCKFINNH